MSSSVIRFVYNLRFPGQYYMAETGLMYNYFRDYDPQTGRYLESDPIGLRGGSYSTYVYAASSPVMYVDQFGLCWLYVQSTGELLHLDSNGYADYAAAGGYSGYGAGLNNPSMESVQQQVPGGPAGPIPAQSYSIGQPFNSAQTGPGAMRLTPIGGLNALNRTDLEIHGDNRARNNTASTGCIIEGPAVRNKIARGLANDNCLRVVP
jgi:RHS repeat-associated protein